MKKISILFLAASFVTAQLYASQPENPPATAALTTDQLKAETERIEADSKRQEAAKKLAQITLEAEQLNKLLSEAKTARQKAEKDAEKEIEEKNAEYKKAKLQHERDLHEFSLHLKKFSPDDKKKYENELQEIELLKLKQEKENLKKTAEKSYTDHAWDIAEKALEKSVETLTTSVPTAFVSTTFQFGSKILETQITNSKRYRWLLLTDDAIKLNELDIKTKELHNSNTIAANDLHKEQIKNAQFERWLKTQEWYDLQLKKSHDRLNHISSTLALMGAQGVNIRKEKTEYEEDLKDSSLDAAKKKQLKEEIEECDTDRAKLIQHRSKKRKLFIKYVETDTDFMMNNQPETSEIPAQFKIVPVQPSSDSEIKYAGC